MDTQVKELIAVGASIAANCQPCLEYHVAKAKEHGVTDLEITEAIDTGRMVRRGAAGKMDKLALTVLESAVVSDTKDPECGCS